MKLIERAAWGYMFVVPLGTGIYSGAAHAVTFAGIGALMLIILNLDKFKSFKAVGVEAELRDAINDAYATIEKLQGIAVKLSDPIVTEITMRGRMLQYIPMKYRYQQIKDIESGLRDLGVTENQIVATTEIFYDAIADDHVKKIAWAVIEDDSAPGELKGMMESYKMNPVPLDEKIEDAVEASEYTPSSDVAELLFDLEHFNREKSFRRIDAWD